MIVTAMHQTQPQTQTHFNSDSHSIADFSFLPIDVVNDEMTRLCKETYWIHKLDTLYPKGMNSKLLYNVE